MTRERTDLKSARATTSSTETRGGEICRPVGAGGAGYSMDPQILTDQLNLSQAVVTDYGHRIWPPRILRPSTTLQLSPENEDTS